MDHSEFALKVTLRGKVQGVGFRYFSLRAAQEIGVAGWVRNCPDGSVEFHVEGDKNLVGTFVRRLRLGPAASDVRSLDEEPAPFADYKDFTVKF